MSDLALDSSDNRRSLTYTKEERALIDIHKDDYLAASGPDQRKAIILTRVYEALKAYWKGRGEKFDASVRQERLVAWIQNAWRKAKVFPEVKPQTVLLNVKKSDVVGRTMKQEVDQELDRLLGPDAQDARKRFGSRSMAIGNIIEKMSPEDIAKLEDEVQRTAHKGYSEDIRRQLVEKHYENRLNASAKLNWLELGMLSITFTAFEDVSGRLQVEAHDRIADLLKLNNPDVKSFEETHPEKVHGMQIIVLEYVRDMLVHYRGLAAKPPSPENVLSKDENGFPRLFPHYKKEGILKETAEKLYRDYLSGQYFLATNRRSDQTPYTQMIHKIADFIDDEYLPPNFEFKDPRNTRIGLILEFLDFISEQEQRLPAAKVFRFHHVKATRKGGDLERSCYPDEYDKETNPGPGAKPAQKRHRTANKNQGRFLHWVPETTPHDNTSAPEPKSLPTSTNIHSPIDILANPPLPPNRQVDPSMLPNIQDSMNQDITQDKELFDRFARIGTFDYSTDQTRNENHGATTTDVPHPAVVNTSNHDFSQYSFSFTQPTNSEWALQAQYMDASNNFSSWNPVLPGDSTEPGITLANRIASLTAANNMEHGMIMATRTGELVGQNANSINLVPGPNMRAKETPLPICPASNILEENQDISLATPGYSNIWVPPTSNSQSISAPGNARIWPRPTPRSHISTSQSVNPTMLLQETLRQMPLTTDTEQAPNVGDMSHSGNFGEVINNSLFGVEHREKASARGEDPGNSTMMAQTPSGSRPKSNKRPLTSDDLAAQEADALRTLGKRVSKRRIRD